MNSLQQLLQRLKLNEPLTGDDHVALVLLLAMALSIAHLLTMLITRWGDRNTAIKSLLASLLIHSVCFLGLEVFTPSTTSPASPTPEPALADSVLVEATQAPTEPQADSSTVIDRPNPPDTQLARLNAEAPEIQAIETPDRRPEVPQLQPPSVQDLSQFRPVPMTESGSPEESMAAPPPQPVSDPGADLDTQDTPVSQIPIAPRLPLPPRTQRSTGSEQLVESDPLTADSRQPSAAPLLPDIPVSRLLSEITPTPQLPTSADPVGEMLSTTAPRSETSVPSPEITPDMASAAPSPVSNARIRLPRSPRPAPERLVVERESASFKPGTMLSQPLRDLYDAVRPEAIDVQQPSSAETIAAMSVPDLPIIQRPRRPPETYRLRDQQTRRETARRFGGTVESEQAVERSLAWLAAVQSSDGRWDASDYGAGLVEIDDNGINRGFAGREADTGITALVTLCFLGAGYTHEQGPYALPVDHALDWLIRQQGQDGNLCGQAEHYARMYCHAMATYALAEACGMQKNAVPKPILDAEQIRVGWSELKLASMACSSASVAQPGLMLVAACSVVEEIAADKLAWSFRRVEEARLRTALARAVQFTISQQDPVSGGWRYRPLQEGDVSMFGWHLMSLKSAELAGVRVPPAVRQRMQSFLKLVAQGNAGGLYGYRRNVVSGGRDSEPVSPVMTAEALFCHQMLGIDPASAQAQEAVQLLVQNPPALSRKDYYYWYYGTLALYQHGGDAWQQWNARLRDHLLAEQIRAGSFAGSWEPTDPWGRYGGRLYSTALATLSLEVYYRFLPLYRIRAENSENSPAATTP